MARPRYFTLEEANGLIAALRPRLQTALQLHGWLRAATAELEGVSEDLCWSLIQGEADLEGADSDTEDALSRARMIYGALAEVVEGIESTGAEVKGIANGLVDFPSICDGGREVLLCWKIGEAQITHFHDHETGFVGRQSIRGHRFGSAVDAPDADHQRRQ